MATSRLAAAGALKAAMNDIYATDTSGNVTGLVGPVMGSNFNFMPPPTSIVLVGDSITAYCNAVVNATSVTSSGTTATVTYTAHGLGVGQQVNIMGATQTAYNGCWTVASVVDANTFTVVLSSVPSAETATGTVQITRGNTFGNCGYWTYINGHKLRLLKNAGVGGQTTSDIFSRLATDVTSLNPDIVVLLAGINDIRGGGATATATWAGIQAIADAIAANGSKLVLCNLLPLGSGDSYFATTVGGLTAPQRIRDVNRKIAAYVEGKSNVVLADLHSVIVDPASSTGAATSAMLSDNLHPSSKGAYAMSQVISAAISKFNVPQIVLNCSAADCYANDTNAKNTIANPTMQGSGGSAGSGSITGTIPASWRVENTGTGAATVAVTARTVSADGDAIGNNLVATVTSGANNDSVTARAFNTYTSQFTNGDWLYADMDLGWSGATNLKNVYAYISVTVGGVQYFSYWGAISDSTNMQTSFRGAIRIPPVNVPSGAITAFTVGVVSTFSGIGGVTLQVGRAQLRKATTLAEIS